MTNDRCRRVTRSNTLTADPKHELKFKKLNIMIYESPTEFPIIVYVFAFHILRCALQKHKYMSTLSYLLKLVYPNVGDVHIGRPMCCLVRIQSYIWAISIYERHVVEVFGIPLFKGRPLMILDFPIWYYKSTHSYKNSSLVEPDPLDLVIPQ